MVLGLLVGAGGAALAVRQFVFGGTPTIHRSATPLPSATCVATPSQANQLAFAIDSEHSSASYVAHFLVQGTAVPGTVTGVTGDIGGSFLISAPSSPKIVMQTMQVVVDLRTLDSGAPARDDHVRNDTFEVDKYPLAKFTAQSVTVLSAPYVDGQTLTFNLPGNLTMHGETRAVTFEMQGKATHGTIMGTGTTVVHIQDWNMKDPEITSVLTIAIQPDIALTIKFVAHEVTCVG
jgi:polyisoprenoid-binding protein YceI